MMHLLAALLFFARLLDALPTGRDLGLEHTVPPSHHHTNPPVVAQSDGASAHSESSWSLSDIESLSPVQWETPPYSKQHSPSPLISHSPSGIRTPDPDHTLAGHSSPSTLVRVQHARGQVGVLHSPPIQHYTESPVASNSDSTHAGSSWSLSDLHLLSPIQWDSPPSSRPQSPPHMPAPSNLHVKGNSALRLLEPASKRLKKHHPANSSPRHRPTFPPVVSESHGSSTDSRLSRSSSNHHLGSHEQEVAYINNGNVAPTIKPPTELKPWTLPKLGLTVTAKAHPHEVENALHVVQDRYKPGNVQSRHRISILRTAVASIADGCTSKSQYIKCMKEKYGADLVGRHHMPLGRIIKKDMDEKAANGLRKSITGRRRIDPHIQTAEHSGKWFAVDSRKEEEHMKLVLPPAHRKEPQVMYKDRFRYQELIKHLDPFQLSAHEYIKHGYRPFEEDPDRWKKNVPRKAMIRHLVSKGASKAMIDHFRKTHQTLLQSVSVVRAGVADCRWH